MQHECGGRDSLFFSVYIIMDKSYMEELKFN